ncbi:MAG: hypothetical protein JRD89_05250 [Deltaproteobacteria bacterium]|nr:hypothetical protein [Deltaproteobacteria bacterium]
MLTNLRWFGKNGKTWVRKRIGSEWVEEEGFSPYFFVREADEKYLPPWVSVERGDWVTVEGERCVKVSVSLPSDVVPLRDSLGCPTFEADVPYVRRYTIDTGETYSPSPDVLFFDVEASVEEGFPKPENPQGRILSISAVDERGNEYFICHDSEKEIYREFSILCKKYAFLVGFNSGHRPSFQHTGGGEEEGEKSVLSHKGSGGKPWDLPYLVARARRMGYAFDYRQTCWGDLMRMYEKVTQHRSGSLSSLSEEILGKKMEKPLARGSEILRWFKEDRERLREYNLEDCRVLREINRELNLVEIFSEIAHLARVSYTDAQSVYCVVDALVLAEARKKNLVFPTGAERAEGESPAGALVLSPRPGLHGATFEYDFRSMYPNIISTFNIGLETVGRGIRTEVLEFREDVRSVFATVVEKLMDARRRYKEKYSETGEKRFDIKQNALKVVANSVYGAMAFKGSRYYRKELAESVTLTGREILRTVVRLLEKRGVTVLYSDTDSVFLNQRIDEGKINEELRYILSYRYGVPEKFHSISLEFKGKFGGAFFPPGREKKRYVLFDEVGNVVEVKGFELVRKNTPKIVAKVQADIFRIMGTTLSDPSKLEEKIKAYLASFKKSLIRGEFDGELSMRSGVRGEDEYTAKNAPQVKALRKLIEMGFPPREEVEFVIADIGKNGLVIEPLVGGKVPEITPRGRKHYWESRILPRVEGLLGKKIDVEGIPLERWL